MDPKTINLGAMNALRDLIELFDLFVDRIPADERESFCELVSDHANDTLFEIRKERKETR